MGFIDDIAPSPADRAGEKLENGELLKCDSNDKTTLFIYKTKVNHKLALFLISKFILVN